MGFLKLKMDQNQFSAPAGGAYDTAPRPLVGWGGDTHSPFPYSRRLRRLDLAAFDTPSSLGLIATLHNANS